MPGLLMGKVWIDRTLAVTLQLVVVYRVKYALCEIGIIIAEKMTE